MSVQRTRRLSTTIMVVSLALAILWLVTNVELIAIVAVVGFAISASLTISAWFD